MRFQRSNIPDLDTYPSETIQAYLDAIAALSIKHGLVIDFANLMPTYPGIGGYCLRRSDRPPRCARARARAQTRRLRLLS